MAIIGRFWRTYTRWGVFQVLVFLITWNTFLERFFVPGSLWAQYFWRSTSIDLHALEKDWTDIFHQEIASYLKAGDASSLQRLLPRNFTPIELFYQYSPSKGGRCFGHTNNSSHFEAQWLSVVGPQGIIGHAHQKKNGFYTISPIASAGTRLSVTLLDKKGIFLAQGDGRMLRGVDSDRFLAPGDQLVTLACDPYYPPFYPVAEVIEVFFSQKEDAWIFHARPLQVLEHLSYAMIYHRSDLEQIDAP